MHFGEGVFYRLLRARRRKLVSSHFSLCQIHSLAPSLPPSGRCSIVIAHVDNLFGPLLHVATTCKPEVAPFVLNVLKRKCITCEFEHIDNCTCNYGDINFLIRVAPQHFEEKIIRTAILYTLMHSCFRFNFAKDLPCSTRC